MKTDKIDLSKPIELELTGCDHMTQEEKDQEMIRIVSAAIKEQMKAQEKIKKELEEE